MKKVIPAFLSSNTNTCDAFYILWDTGEKIYKSLSQFSINNYGSLEYEVVQLP